MLALLLVSPGAAVANVSVTPDPTAKVAGGVYGMAQVEDRTVIGGLFTAVGGEPRSNVAAIGADGSVDPLFNPGVNGKVMAVAASEDGTVVFLGGTFTEAGGAPRANLAAVDAITGVAVAEWTADTSGTYADVVSLAVDGNRLYVGGRFTGIDGKTTHKRLVAIDTVTGNLISAFRPSPDKGVTEVVVAPDHTVYAGGPFTMLGGQPRLSAGSVDPATGTATGFAPSGNGGPARTIALSPDGSRFFYGTENNTLFAYDPAVSNDPVWLIKTSGNTQAIVVSDTEMWIGGHFSQVVTGHIARPYVASLDPVDGSVNEWNPNCVGGKLGVWALVLEGNHLHLGGQFTGFGTTKQRGYARFTQVA
jgi:WD40 repeat protein